MTMFKSAHDANTNNNYSADFLFQHDHNHNHGHVHDHDQQYQQDHDHFHTFLPVSVSPPSLHNIDCLFKPAFTEAAFVKCHSDAFAATLSRLYEGAMELDPGQSQSESLRRTASHASHTSNRSQRSQTVRAKPRKYSSYVSSSASSIADSDKSLTSFPSFSPESPKDDRGLASLLSQDGTVRKASGQAPSIVESLTTSSPAQGRTALFDDEPLSLQKVPGSLHLANDEHIERVIARSGATTLIRQLAEDLAMRDAQVAALRRKAEERERALRKIILECGLSNLDTEKRLREIEDNAKLADDSSSINVNAQLEDMIHTAMGDVVDADSIDPEATLRVTEPPKTETKNTKGTAKGWGFLWGGTAKKTSGSSSVNGDHGNPSTSSAPKAGQRKTVLQNDLFHPPAPTSSSSPSRASGVMTRPPPPERKPSAGFAALALKLVAGNMIRDDPPSSRGRANSVTSQARTPSAASARTSISTKSAAQRGTESLHSRRKTLATPTIPLPANRSIQDRWDTMVASPPGSSSGNDNSGPVEMDAILDPDTQPPTVTQAYNNQWNSEFLTDRFGFIYDQRRKKRQREAADAMRKSKRGSRVEMLSGSRAGMSPTETEHENEFMDERPDTPTSNEESAPAKKWQDYLKIATFPTELLSHTPMTNVPTMEVMEGESAPTSPGISSEQRGFVPHASTTTQPNIMGAENATISKPASSSATDALSKEDVEPVKLLLAQLGEVHDSLQREKTVRWNDFLRKVRAERRRDGEAAAALAAAGQPRARGMAMMPEISISDGEMIGIAGLGVKGKVGRAKWTEFKSLVLGGIPVSLRAKIWAECSGALGMRVPGYYDDLVARRTGSDDPVIVAQIQMDIHRTLTDNIFFRRGPGVAKLTEVLLAYSRRNPEVGYCQGMNLITACLLLIMPTAEDAFWILCSIIENILPRGYYDHSLLASRADQQVLRQYVSEILPKLSQHLDDLSIELEALTFQWFLSVFTDCLSAEALFRVWDVVLCTNDGSTFLFQVALALLKLNESMLLKEDSPAGIYTYINHQMTNHAISIDGLLQASEGLRRVVKREDVEARRDKAIAAEKELVKVREERNLIKRAERLAKMNEASAENEAETNTMPVIDASSLVDTVSQAGTASFENENGTAGVIERGGIERRPSQLELGGDEYGELTVRTPMPIEEEAALSLG